MEVWLTLVVGSAVLFATMIGLWWSHGRRGNAGIVDVAWTLGVGSMSLAYCATAVHGNLFRRLILAVIVTVWSGRLAWHIWRRVHRMPEDGRYVALKEAWGDQAPRKMLYFFMFQAIAAVVFSLPMLVAATNPHEFGLFDTAAIILAIIVLGGEAVADRQLQEFREQPANRGKACRVGLWRYSRHPNYFFEWLHWFVYVLLAWTAPYGWVTVLAPLAMLHFVLNVTGVPPTERQALLSRGEDYRRYQQETSVFFPWPPRLAKPSVGKQTENRL
jgi:steroid 5-alpha reductase family enzyme